MGISDTLPNMTAHSYQISLKDRGRIVIPAGLRREAGFSEEVELVATSIAGGGFIVRSRQQILDSLWEKTLSSGVKDVVSEFVSEREIAALVRLQELEHPHIGSQSEIAARETKILIALGL